MGINSRNRQSKLVLRGRLTGEQRNRLGKLLDMMYTTSELAAEIGVDPRRIRQIWVPSGCPHNRDQSNHILINGAGFRRWYERTYARISLASDQAFCMTCRRGVPMVQAIEKQKAGLTYRLSDCPSCGRRLAKIVAMEREREAS